MAKPLLEKRLHSKNDEGEGWVNGGEGLKQPFTRISRLYIDV